MLVKKITLLLMILCVEPAIAGSVAGFGGGTEVTQILNNIQLVQQYQQQVQQFAMQGLQLDAQLKNLIKNPGSNLSGDAANLIRKIGGVMSAEQSMGGSLAQIDKKFAATFNSPTAASYSQKYSQWTTVSKGTLQSAMQSAGLRRDQYATDTDALQALYNESQSTDGDLSALQTLSKINIQQVQQTQALGDLMATQNIAANTFMATQASKGQAAADNNDAIQNGFIATKPTTLPALDTGTRAYKKWNLY
jgi:P-type conjugative transfer protein TrbJ